MSERIFDYKIGDDPSAAVERAFDTQGKVGGKVVVEQAGSEVTRVGRAVELSPADADVACQREFGRPARTMEEKLAFAYELAER